MASALDTNPGEEHAIISILRVCESTRCVFVILIQLRSICLLAIPATTTVNDIAPASATNGLSSARLVSYVPIKFNHTPLGPPLQKSQRNHLTPPPLPPTCSYCVNTDLGLDSQANTLLDNAKDTSARDWMALYGDVRTLRQSLEPTLLSLSPDRFEQLQKEWRGKEVPAPSSAEGIAAAISTTGVTMIATLNARQTALAIARCAPCRTRMGRDAGVKGFWREGRARVSPQCRLGGVGMVEGSGQTSQLVWMVLSFLRVGEAVTSARVRGGC